MTTIPWSANKNARQVYREYVDRWGATYEGDTSDGHHVFRFPNGIQTTLAHSPSAGHSWVKARRDEAAKITGQPFRGKRDTHAAKRRREREATERRTQRDAVRAILAEREQAHALRQRIDENIATIRNIRAGMHRLHTRAQRAYAERAIAELVADTKRLSINP